MKKNKFKIILILIIIISIIFKIFVIQKTPLKNSTQIDAKIGEPETLEDYENLYDLDYYETDSDEPKYGHFYYIMYLYTNHNLCNTTDGQCYHPPIHYIISATWLTIVDIFPLNSMQKIESLQFIRIILFHYFNFYSIQNTKKT